MDGAQSLYFGKRNREYQEEDKMNWLIELIMNSSYNRKLYKDGKANKNEIRLTSIGYRSSEDQSIIDKDKSASGNIEYSKIIRSKNK